MKLELSGQIFEKKNTQISNFMKICPVGAESFHALERTDTTKLFCNFATAITDVRRYTSLAPYVLIAYCLVKDTGKFAFTLTRWQQTPVT